MANSRIPFTDSQWEELKHQALIFKYIAANIPVPPHLLFLIRRPFLFSSSSSSCATSSFLSSHFGWEMGMGRKIDAEPGRCKRTDGKKWRCSKEASQGSKYCERHMHRGKSRCSSRKPPQEPCLFLDSPLSSSRIRRSLSIEDDNSSCGYESLKQREKQPKRHCFILGTDLKTHEKPLMLDEMLKQREETNFDEGEEEERRKKVYRFLDEWPSSKSSVSTSLFI